jgi:hypothetical protein
MNLNFLEASVGMGMCEYRCEGEDRPGPLTLTVIVLGKTIRTAAV